MVNITEFINQFQASVDFVVPEEIKPDTQLANLPEWDSIAQLSVIVMFDIEYGKAITGDDIKGCETISDLFALLG